MADILLKGESSKSKGQLSGENTHYVGQPDPNINIVE